MELTLLHADMAGDQIKENLFSWAIANHKSECVAVVYASTASKAKKNAIELSKSHSLYIQWAAEREAEAITGGNDKNLKKTHSLLKLAYDQLKEDNNKLAKDNNMLMSKLSNCEHKYVFLRDDSYYTQTRYTNSYFLKEVFFCEKCLTEKIREQTAYDVSIYNDQPDWAINITKCTQKA